MIWDLKKIKSKVSGYTHFEMKTMLVKIWKFCTIWGQTWQMANSLGFTVHNSLLVLRTNSVYLHNNQACITVSGRHNWCVNVVTVIVQHGVMLDAPGGGRFLIFSGWNPPPSSARRPCLWIWPPWRWCCRGNRGRRTGGRCSWRRNAARPGAPWWSGRPLRCWRCPTARLTPGSWTVAAACPGQRTWCRDPGWPRWGFSGGSRQESATWPRCLVLARNRWNWWSLLRSEAECKINTFNINRRSKVLQL